MEVTSANFEKVLPKIEEAINQSTFISIDCEFTGLNVIRNINAFDTPKQYYEKVKTNCKDFLVIQYGIALFRFDQEAKLFRQQCYNFFIFRRPINKHIFDQRFLCQTTSIDFLINQGFDFNKLFKEGIPYLNEEENESCKNNIDEFYKNSAESQQSNNFDYIPVPDNAKEFVGDVIKQIEEFLETECEEIQLPKCNAFFRRLIYQTKREKFADKIYLETRQISGDRILFVRKIENKEDEVQLVKEKYENQLKELDGFRGFTKVLNMITQSEKLVVGHNICLDLLHTIDKFVMPLPKDYDDFKEMAHLLFPKLLDTKYMSSIEPFKDLINVNILKQLLDTVSEKPFEMPKVELDNEAEGYEVASNKEHEAGFDAYITGLSFLAMWRYLGKMKNMKDTTIFSNFKLLEPYMNKIFLMTLTDNQYINLAGQDLNPSRDHVFYLTVPKEWKNNNIVQLFSPFGKVFISWVNDRSVYVRLHQRDQAAIALSTLSQSDTYEIMTFAKRKANLEGRPAFIPSPLVLKRRRDSEGPPNKRRKTNSFNSSNIFPPKRSIDPIEEQIESEDNSPKRSKKTFEEDHNWE